MNAATEGFRKTLQCDDGCDLTWATFEDRISILHVRGDESDRVVVKRPLTGEPGSDAFLRAIEAALAPLRLKHWHEPIPNWVGEGLIR